ncbi:YfhO family protein [Streptomyces tricolor]|nr:YfhO family protein [Streptomyces tricolor]
MPFHAHLWDLLHGRAEGGLLVNWQSGYGASFLPDLGTYLGSPFAPLVALFPRDEIDPRRLRRHPPEDRLRRRGHGPGCCSPLRPGRWWAAGLLGASYALCGWSLADASHSPSGSTA